MKKFEEAVEFARMRSPAEYLRIARASYSALHRGLGPLGWTDSVATRRPTRRNGEPLPWFTYPSIDFLESRVQADWTVFEFGAGQSTLWWAAKVKRVVACEHDTAWLNELTPEVPENVELIHRELDGGYVNSVAEYSGLDVVVIDGRRRNACARKSVESLSQRGFIIWDNSDREHYAIGKKYLAGLGFRHIDWTGFGPGFGYRWQTSVYYRDGNALGI